MELVLEQLTWGCWQPGRVCPQTEPVFIRAVNVGLLRTPKKCPQTEPVFIKAVNVRLLTTPKSLSSNGAHVCLSSQFEAILKLSLLEQSAWGCWQPQRVFVFKRSLCLLVADPLKDVAVKSSFCWLFVIFLAVYKFSSCHCFMVDGNQSTQSIRLACPWLKLGTLVWGKKISRAFTVYKQTFFNGNTLHLWRKIYILYKFNTCR